MNDKTYRAFLSYSHVDRRWAKWLHKSLESFRTPATLIENYPDRAVPARLSPIFRDRDELPSAADLGSNIRKALEESENLVVICSPGAAQSRWVDQEIRIFKELGRSDRVFSFIVDGSPGENDEASFCFPPALLEKYDRTGNLVDGWVEPIAADARPNADGRSLALLKIIAGLLDVGLDDLRQRELQRKHRRMAAVTAGSLAALAVTVLLAVNAYMARNDANQRREQAEDLLSFMVVDLRDSLTPIGRLDLLEKVGDQAMAYFATVKAADLSDEELSRHAQVLTQLGEIRMSQRQFETALNSFMEAWSRSAELVKNSPDDGEYLFGRGQAEFWVGYVHWRRADLVSAREWLTKYRDSSRQLLQFDRSRNDWSREIAYGDHNLAVLALESGDLDAAELGFRNELVMLLELQEADEDVDLRRDISDVVSWLGNIAFEKGELSAAKSHYESAANDQKTLLDEEPDNAGRRNDWAYAMHWIAEIDAITGRPVEAEAMVARAVEIFDDLIAQDPENTEWKRAGMRSWILFGKLLAARSEWRRSRGFATKSAQILEELLGEEASDVAALEQLADAHHLLAWIEFNADDYLAAVSNNQKAARFLSQLAESTEPSSELLGKLAQVLVFGGRLQAVGGQHQSATQHWQQAEDLLSQKITMTNHPLLLDPWTRLMLLSGRRKEAQQSAAKLEQSAYYPIRPWPDIAQ